MTDNTDDKQSYIPVSDMSGQPINGLYRSSDTGAIVSGKNSEYQKYLQEKERIRKMNSLESEVSELKGQLSDIKNLLNQMVNQTK